MPCCCRRRQSVETEIEDFRYHADASGSKYGAKGRYTPAEATGTPQSSRTPSSWVASLPSRSNDFDYNQTVGSMADVDLGHLEGPLEKAQDLVQQLRRGEDVSAMLRDLGFAGAFGKPCGQGSTMMVVYTDLEPDDMMAIAQLWQWRVEVEGMEGQPLIIQHVNFDSKDHGSIFEMKQLAARLMLGAVDIHALTHEGDQGGTRLHNDSAHPQAATLAQDRPEVLETICEQLASFSGERIDMYILSPGGGNLGAILRGLEDMGAWPLPAELHVAMYTGSFTLRGMHKSDIAAIEKLVGHASSPLLDINKLNFFGGAHCHSTTASIATFAATAEFAKTLSKTSPLLAAALKLINDEFNKHLIHPRNRTLFEGAELSKKEAKSFESIKTHFGHGESEELMAYAKAILEDRDIFSKVADRLKTTIRAFAYGGCDLPLCSQLLFLHCWLQRERPDWLAHDEGSWTCSIPSGTSTVMKGGPGAVGGVSPRLVEAADSVQFGQVLEEYFFRHLRAVEQRNKMDVKGNLCWNVDDEHIKKARFLISRLHAGENYNAVFQDFGLTGTFEGIPKADETALMVVYTDLEPDDCMAIAQLWQWKKEKEGMVEPPLILQHVNFDSKDHGTTFEMKQLIAKQLLGGVDIHALMHEGDQGGARQHDDAAHPKAAQLMMTRESTLSLVCSRIACFAGSRIELYILSPGCGNLAALMEGLENLGAWPLRYEFRVSLYSGPFTVRGMHRADMEALEKFLSLSQSPLIDINRDAFFTDDAHSCTETLASFALPEFAQQLSLKAPLLAATLQLYNEEFVKHQIGPESRCLFERVLHGEEARRFESRIKPLFKRGETVDARTYARALMSDEELFDKVAESKKSALRTFAHGGCELPLEAQVVFLYEWAKYETPESIKPALEGTWFCDQCKGSTMIKPRLDHGIIAVQPCLRMPKDSSLLTELRTALWKTLELHLDSASIARPRDIPLDGGPWQMPDNRSLLP
eukprot:TRINITY_DN29082_c0_g1_i1.p1 TRINITY_DN29082_c0_g1~~TRINITY_DN29082_c0_g1_i1.p1  ORF type:complete len:981 (-),score=211.41 TRINITY_DN29082_c0_g1_i1:86-3028(-)